jgi:hypothetical protein
MFGPLSGAAPLKKLHLNVGEIMRRIKAKIARVFRFGSRQHCFLVGIQIGRDFRQIGRQPFDLRVSLKGKAQHVVERAVLQH